MTWWHILRQSKTTSPTVKFPFSVGSSPTFVITHERKKSAEFRTSLPLSETPSFTWSRNGGVQYAQSLSWRKWASIERKMLDIDALCFHVLFVRCFKLFSFHLITKKWNPANAVSLFENRHFQSHRPHRKKLEPCKRCFTLWKSSFSIASPPSKIKNNARTALFQCRPHYTNARALRFFV